MPWLLSKALPFILRGVGARIVERVAGVLLRRVAEKTPSTLDDEIVKIILDEKEKEDVKTGRAS